MSDGPRELNGTINDVGLIHHLPEWRLDAERKGARVVGLLVGQPVVLNDVPAHEGGKVIDTQILGSWFPDNARVINCDIACFRDKAAT